MTAQERYELWCTSPLVGHIAKEELEQIRNDPAEIEDRFYRELSFGTAGLRGILGFGDNRMNVYVVRRATQGLADYLKTQADTPSVAIAYDSRRFSSLFAKETACVLSANGIKVYLYGTLHSVPQLSYTILHLKCTAGVVITASHNPPKYNGYKVYWSHGGQVGPEQADAITECIRRVPDFDCRFMPLEEAVKQGRTVYIGEEIDETYYTSLMTLLSDPERLRAHGSLARIVYTPLHGSGFVPVTTLLKRIGIENVFPVKEQSEPDGAFPTVTAPNPEDPAAFTLGMKLADEVNANLILATDPDADRLGCAVKTKSGAWQVLTGNQIASLLLYTLLTNRKERGLLPDNGLVVRSMVSTHLADAIVADFGACVKEVQTGFRFISEQIDRCEKTGEHTFLFGFEESYGYLAGTFARDKDAVCSAMLLSEAAVCYAEKGLTLADALEEIYRHYGRYAEGGKSFTLEGKAGTERIAAAMVSLRNDPPASIGGIPVAEVLDYLDTAKTGMTAGNVLRFTLGDGSYLMVRPSGTEPKLKLYTGCRAESADELEKVSAGLLTASAALVGERLGL